MMTDEVNDLGASSEEREFLQALRGELSLEGRRTFADRLAAEPELADRFARWTRAWEAVVDPAAVQLRPDFAASVVQRGAESAGEWQRAPIWLRSAAAAALVVGVAFGAGWGRRLEPPREQTEILAGESYGSSFEDSGITLWEALATGADLTGEGEESAEGDS